VRAALDQVRGAWRGRHLGEEVRNDEEDEADEEEEVEGKELRAAALEAWVASGVDGEAVNQVLSMTWCLVWVYPDLHAIDVAIFCPVNRLSLIEYSKIGVTYKPI
jgi:hypothetical protein